MSGLVYLTAAVVTYRLTRLVAQDGITQGIRDRLATAADAGVQTTAAGTPASAWQRWAAWLDELILCGWCLSLWLGTGVALGWLVLASPDVGWQHDVWAVATSALVSSAFTGAMVWLLNLIDPDNR